MFWSWLALLVVPASVAAPCGDTVLLEASNIFAHATVVGYRHFNASAAEQLQVKAKCEWTSRNDCSGFVSFILQRTVPRAYATVQACEQKTRHPRAITYAQFFQGLETNRTAARHAMARTATRRHHRVVFHAQVQQYRKNPYSRPRHVGGPAADRATRGNRGGSAIPLYERAGIG